MVLGLLATASVLGAPAPPTPRLVEVSGAVVRLGDLSDLSRLDKSLRERAAETPILVLRPGSTAVLTASQIQDRARRRMPLLATWRPDDAAGVIVRRATHATDISTALSACVRPRRAIERGKIMTDGDFVDWPCDGPSRTAWRYDHTARALRTDRDLAIDDTLAAPPAGLLAAVRPGQTVRLAVRVGAVAVERDVQAVQAARKGRPAFVKADGEIFSVAAVERAQ